MKRTKRCPVFFSFYDRTGIEDYLEQQAEAGWMLDKTSALGWRFRRIQPQKIHFNVVYFPQASAFDPEPSEGQQSFADFCRHTGWQLAVSNAQMQIFYNEADNPTPIETDAALEVAAIHAAAKKTHLCAYYLLAGAGLLQMALFGWRLMDDPIAVLSSNASLSVGLYWGLLLALCLVELMGYHRWHSRAQRAAELNGSFVETKSHRQFQLAILCLALLSFALVAITCADGRAWMIALASMAGILGVTAIIVAASAWMKRRRLSARVNRRVTIALAVALSIALAGVAIVCIMDAVVSLNPQRVPADTYELDGRTYYLYDDRLPLTLEDLTDTAADGYSYELHTLGRSLLMERQVAIQQPRWDAGEKPRLEYSILTVKASTLYDWAQSALLKDFARNDYAYSQEQEQSARPVDPDPWGAQEAYQLYLGDESYPRFLLCYETRMVEIDLEQGWTLTGEQMATVGEKLGG